MSASRRFVAALLLLTLGALAFRLPALGNRPMHGDEAVHAFKFRELREKGVYHYDRNEYHGPTIYYAALPNIVLTGKNFLTAQEADYRFSIALFGGAMVLLLLPLADGLGRRSALWAGLLLALSPAFVFYSRYYIQELPFVFFTLGALAGAWRFWRSRRPIWLLAAGVCGGLMIASKETVVFTFLAFGIALPLSVFWTRCVDGVAPDIRPLWRGRLPLFALLIGLLTACLFLSGFLTNPVGPLDYLRSYTPWLTRAGGTGLHRQPWRYYLQILFWTHEKGGPVWSEGLIVGLSVVGLITALLPKAKSRLEGSAALARFLAFFTLILTALYSLIPYKTPWCLLSFLLGMILLAGIGADTLVRLAPGKVGKGALILVLLAGCAQLGRQACRASFQDYTDNPYAYAQPVPDIEKLKSRVEELAKASPDHENMVIKVFSVDEYYWPLPWTLRRFPNIGYWTQIPQDVDAPLVLVSPEFDEEATKRLDATHLMTGYYSMRPNAFFQVWVRMDLWTKYLEIKKASQPKEPGE